jgi:hypothetical protein
MTGTNSFFKAIDLQRVQILVKSSMEGIMMIISEFLMSSSKENNLP